MVTLFVKFRVKEGKEQEAASICLEMAKNVREKEEGTLMYVPYTAVNDPAQIFYLEKYKDREAMHAHSKTEYYRDLAPKMEALIDGSIEAIILKELG